MYSIRREYIRFCKNTDKILNFYNFTYPLNEIRGDNKSKLHLYSSGMLNGIWQLWNRFWKVYWMAYFLGGLDFNNCKIAVPLVIASIIPSKAKPPKFSNQYDVSYYLLHLLGRRKKNIGKITGTYQEPIWGDINIITSLSSSIIFPGYNILNAISVIGNAPKHMQLVRNASIHMDKDTIIGLKINVIPYYSVADFKYPSEIIYSEDLFSKKYALISWVDDLIAFIQLI